MDFPRTLKVGYVDYTVEIWDPAQADAADRMGEADRVRRIIRIDVAHGPRTVAETLLHEILHVAWEMWNVPDKGEVDEETVVGPLSRGIATIWRDNPTMFAWLDWHLTVAKETA